MAEEAGFEPLVPLCGVVVSGWNRNAGIGEEDDSKALSAAGTERSNLICSGGESANFVPERRTVSEYQLIVHPPVGARPAGYET
jgi:hypothetical protein